MPARACSFDFGQTLASIDTDLLVRKLQRIGIGVSGARAEASLASAWTAYDLAIRRGQGGHPWKVFMRSLLEASEPTELDVQRDPDSATSDAFSDAITRAVDWLWDDQPVENLWRKPIPGMLELCAELRARGVRYGVLSNSEGKLRELIEKMGCSHLFDVVADSGCLGMEKPDPRIFEWFAAEIAEELGAIVHIGDSLEADIEGALAVGMRAIWFSPRDGAGRANPSQVSDPERVRICRDADEVRTALIEFGIPL